MRAILAAALLSVAAAPASGAEGARHWAVPDHAKLQLAGNVGFLSPGVGWAWLGERLETDLFLGWVPPGVGGESIWALTGKLTFAPWRLRPGSGWSLRPLTAALQLTYTFGEEYVLRLPDHYPSHYYAIPSALRGGLALGASVGRPAWGLPEVSLYGELVALDAMLFFWAKSPDALDADDVVSVALGVRAAF